MRAMRNLMRSLPIPDSRCGRQVPLVLGALVLACGPLSAQAGEAEGGPDTWWIPASSLEGCVGAQEQGGSAGFSDLSCFVDLAFSQLAGVALDFAEEQGQTRFGEHFQIDRRIGFTASGREFSADVDVVIPLHALASVTDGAVTRSFFVQNGVTRWRDEHGFQRSDVRLGVVNRHALSEGPGSAYLGTSMFVQENLERGHTRVVSGLEYLDGWGTGSLNYFVPVTGWQPGRPGYEERPLAGVELDFKTDLTSTIELGLAAGRWESKDGTDTWEDRGRLGIGWAPHPWFELNGSWHDIGRSDDSVGLRAGVTVPFGGADWSPTRWRGLGRDEPETEGPDADAIWDSVDHVGQIEVAERGVATPDDAEQDGADSLTLIAKSASYSQTSNSE